MDDIAKRVEAMRMAARAKESRTPYQRTRKSMEK